MQVEVTREDQNVFLTVNGISATSETAARVYQGLAFTWEVEQLARHRHQARAEVVGEIVAWMREAEWPYRNDALIAAIEAGEYRNDT